MTSNLGLKEFNRHAKIGFETDFETEKISYDDIKSIVLKEIKNHFKPEFLNRVDKTIVFQPLDKESLAKIIDLQIKELADRLLEKNIKLKISNEVKEYLTTKGYDPTYGARPLKRIIQNEILDELALQIIEKKILEGDRVSVRLENGKIVFRK